MKSKVLTRHVQTVRSFNRFYTRLLGLLERELPETEFSLPYARVLHEIAEGGAVTAADLALQLQLDRGYLSRMLADLEGRRLIKRSKSQHDARSYLLELTAAGQKKYVALDRAAAKQVSGLLSPLAETARAELVQNLARAHKLLRGSFEGPARNEIPTVVMRDQRPGDAGFIIHRHGVLYSEEFGFDQTFEAYVADGLARFLEDHDPKREKLWVVENNGQIGGAAAVVRSSRLTAQLRWLYLEPSLRRQGLGTRLMEEALHFGKTSGYRRMILWSVDRLKAARGLYSRCGFELAEERTLRIWGQQLTEEKWKVGL